MFVQEAGQARVAQGRELQLPVLVVDHVELGIDVARVDRQLVEAAVQLLAQDRGEGLVADLRGVGHPVLPLRVEAALEDDGGVVAQRDAVLARQLLEERPAAAVAVHVLVRVEVGGQAAHLLAEDLELPADLGPAGEGIVELDEALRLVREVHVKAHGQEGAVPGQGTASSVARPFTTRVAEVTMPRSWVSAMPRLIPPPYPKSSALTIK